MTDSTEKVALSRDSDSKRPLTANTSPSESSWLQGACPRGCGKTLFVGEGGYVTCSFIECPDPLAAHDALVARFMTGAAASETSSTRSSGEVLSTGGPAAPDFSHEGPLCPDCGFTHPEGSHRREESLSEEGRKDALDGAASPAVSPSSESDFFCRIDIGEVQLFIENGVLWIYDDHEFFQGEPLEQAIPKLRALLGAAILEENARKIG